MSFTLVIVAQILKSATADDPLELLSLISSRPTNISSNDSTRFYAFRMTPFLLNKPVHISVRIVRSGASQAYVKDHAAVV